MPRKPMITRADVDRALGAIRTGTPHERCQRLLAIVLKISKAEIDRREAAWRAAHGRRKVTR